MIAKGLLIRLASFIQIPIQNGAVFSHCSIAPVLFYLPEAVPFH
jgi:hypothetical protein